MDDEESTPRKWDSHPLEDEYNETRRESKQDRKLAQAKDRSKYKKTDLEKWQKTDALQKLSKISKNDLKKGRILSISSQEVCVDCDGQLTNCILRGQLKHSKTQFKNLLVVGDFVWFQEGAPGEGSIVEVEPRHSILSRADNLSRRKEQLIAANIDQVLITVCVVMPPLKPFIVDRYIIATSKGGMKPVIVINKVDLLQQDGDNTDNERELYQEFISAYQPLGIPVISLSMVDGTGLDELREVMKNKASVFAGQSGVGKTSLINALTGLDLRTGPAVDKTKKGAHTTSQAKLLPLSFGGWCVDTPGIKSFGVWDLRKDEIEGYFYDIHEIGLACKYPDCSHSHESDCAVIEALEKGTLSPLRFQSYQNLMESVSTEHKRR